MHGTPGLPLRVAYLLGCRNARLQIDELVMGAVRQRSRTVEGSLRGAEKDYRIYRNVAVGFRVTRVQTIR